MNVLESTQWGDVFVEEVKKQYFIDLQKWLCTERRHETIFPPEETVFDAFKHCELSKLKVVILGQDPYHGFGQAHGLSFSVNEGIALPKSLRNIYKELQDDLGVPAPITGNLTTWAKQGVLLLNSVLTVREAHPGSHQNKGWEFFTDHVISSISDQRKNVVFVLWGNYARSKKHLIDISKHLVVESVHPSPLSAYRGFFGSKPFSKINSYLEARGVQQINW